ncbi:MAG: ATP-dependent Clp protease ATP-binding subunit ClpA, partial [Alphaproteobacteria bacterium]|nr:ATP-dependent Clp protease ATP-binding subunit ClpA [Alphaproteobacteria bacterium]
DSERRVIGFGNQQRQDEDKEALKRIFTPEFRNRLDATVPFGHLDQEVVEDVVNKFVFKLETQLADRHVTIELNEAARKWLATKGYDRRNGARPLERLIQDKVKAPLADEVLFGKLSKGGVVRVSVEKDELVFKFSQDPERRAASARKRRQAEDDGELVG